MKDTNSNNTEENKQNSKSDIPPTPIGPFGQEPDHHGINKEDKKPKAAFIISLFALAAAIAAAGFSYWQIVVAKDTAYRQLRAYAVPDSIVTNKDIRTGPPINLTLFVNNMGQSPAYNVSQACVFRVAQAPHNYLTSEFKKGTDRGITIIGNKPVPFGNVSTSVSDKEISDVLSSKYRLFYYSIVRYHDIFKQSHVLHVCAEYSVQSNSFTAMPDCNYEE